MSSRIAFLLPLAAIVGVLIPGRSSGQVVATYQTGLTRAWGIEFDPAGNLYVSGRVGISGSSGLPSAMYVARLRAGDRELARRLVVLR